VRGVWSGEYAKANRLQSDWKAITMRFKSDCKSIAKRL
jgi:hypothetical protein